jgi:hypothetical protein
VLLLGLIANNEAPFEKKREHGAGQDLDDLGASRGR